MKPLWGITVVITSLRGVPSGSFSRSDMTPGTLSGFSVTHCPCAIKLRRSYKSSIRPSTVVNSSISSLGRCRWPNCLNKSVLCLASRCDVTIRPSSILSRSKAHITCSITCSISDHCAMHFPIWTKISSPTSRTKVCSGRRGITGGFEERFAIGCLNGRRAIQRRGSRAAHERGDAARIEHAAATAPYGSSKEKESWRGSTGSKARRRCGRLERDCRASPTSLLIGQPLPARAFDRLRGALGIVDAKRNALVVAEIEFAEIPLQVFRRDVMIGADHAALENAEIAFNGVGVPKMAAHVFLNRMVDGAVAAELACNRRVDRAFVRHHIGRLADFGFQDRLQCRAIHARHVVRANPAVALNQGNNRFLRRNVVLPVPRLAANIGFVDLNHLVRTTKLAVISKRAHRLADTVCHEPRRLVGNIKRAVQLVRRHTFLAAAQQPERQRPFIQRHMAALHDGADRHGESLIAAVAMKQTIAVRLAVEPVDLFRLAAMRAIRAIGPADRLEMLPRFVFVGEDRIGEVHGGSSLSAADATPSVYLCQRDNRRDCGIPMTNAVAVIVAFSRSTE